jgi:hypothetical protein
MAILCLFYSNCAFLRKDEGLHRPNAEVAILKLNSDDILYISKIDDKRIWGDIKDHLEFPPGVHTLSLNFHKSRLKGRAKSFQEFDLSFDAKPGGKYQIKFTAEKDYSKWSACILDTVDNRRVSTLITDTD